MLYVKTYIFIFSTESVALNAELPKSTLPLPKYESYYDILQMLLLVVWRKGMQTVLFGHLDLLLDNLWY